MTTSFKKYFYYTCNIMERNKFEKILNSLYPELILMEYELYERFIVNEEGEFTDNMKPAIFVVVKGESNSGINIGDDISRMTGIDVVVDKIQ